MWKWPLFQSLESCLHVKWPVTQILWFSSVVQELSLQLASSLISYSICDKTCLSVLVLRYCTHRVQDGSVHWNASNRQRTRESSLTQSSQLSRRRWRRTLQLWNRLSNLRWRHTCQLLPRSAQALLLHDDCRLLFVRLKIKKRGAKTSSSVVLTRSRMKNFWLKWRLFLLISGRSLSSRTAVGLGGTEKMQPDRSSFLWEVKLTLHKCWKTRESYALKMGADRSTSAQTDPQSREKAYKKLVEEVKRKRDTETDKVHFILRNKIVSHSKNCKSDLCGNEENVIFHTP
jgi:hypothetical protein